MQHLDILYFNLFFFSRLLSHSMYPPPFRGVSTVISSALCEADSQEARVEKPLFSYSDKWMMKTIY